MKVLHCMVLFLPLVLFGANAIEKAPIKQNAESRQNIYGGGDNITEQALKNAKVIEYEITKDDKYKNKFRDIRTKETSGFMLGLGNVFGYTLAGSV